MHSFRDVIASFGGPAPLATALGLTPEKVRLWRHRNAIPLDRWDDVVNAARARGEERITHELLCRLRNLRFRKLDLAA
jgi:hypothetical protein